MKPQLKNLKLKIKRGDIVQAIAGSEAGGAKSGKVLMVLPSKGKIIVEGLNRVKKHMKPSQDNPQGGVIEKEAPIAISNVRKVEGSEKKPSRAKRKSGDN